MAVCTYRARPSTTETEPENGNTSYDRNGTGNSTGSGNGHGTGNGNGNGIVNLHQYTRLRPEHEYTFVHTRYLLGLSVRILLVRMAFHLPPNTVWVCRLSCTPPLHTVIKDINKIFEGTCINEILTTMAK